MEHSPTTSAVFRATVGEDVSQWTLVAQLLAAATDALNIANWQRGQGRKDEYPKPIPRPGVEQSKHYGKGAIPMDQMASWLGWTD